MQPARRAVVWVCAIALTACAACWAVTGDQTRRIPAHLAVYAIAFAAYGAGLWASRGLSRRGLRAALVLAAIWRLALIPVSPLLSEDVHRYVWEGRVQLHGGNPYKWADRPEAERWVSLRDDLWAGVGYKDYTAVYPPLWQLASRAVVVVSDSLLAMKAFLVACELLTWALLARLLSRRGLPPTRLLIAAWSPLALVEIAGSGHNEPFGWIWLVAALLALESGRPLAGALLGALAFQAKLVPALCAAAWARRFRAWHVVAAAVLAALLIVPYAGAGRGLWRSLGGYARFWRFNETLFAPLAALLGSHDRAVAAAAILLVGLALTLAWRGVDSARAALLVLAAWLLLAPNVLPWYALWLLPFLVLVEAPPLLLFTGTIGLAYLVYPGWLAGEAWQVSWGLRAAEYLPCVALALWTARRPQAGASPPA